MIHVPSDNLYKQSDASVSQPATHVQFESSSVTVLPHDVTVSEQHPFAVSLSSGSQDSQSLLQQPELDTAAVP